MLSGLSPRDLLTDTPPPQVHHDTIEDTLHMGKESLDKKRVCVWMACESLNGSTKTFRIPPLALPCCSPTPCLVLVCFVCKVDVGAFECARQAYASLLGVSLIPPPFDAVALPASDKDKVMSRHHPKETNRYTHILCVRQLNKQDCPSQHSSEHATPPLVAPPASPPLHSPSLLPSLCYVRMRRTLP